jgi:hypothetical protein
MQVTHVFVSFAHVHYMPYGRQSANQIHFPAKQRSFAHQLAEKRSSLTRILARVSMCTTPPKTAKAQGQLQANNAAEQFCSPCYHCLRK